VLTAEIPAAAVARHEGHPDSIFGFASITLAGATGFRHRYVSTIGCINSRDNLISMMGAITAGSCPSSHTNSSITDNTSVFMAQIHNRHALVFESQSQRRVAGFL
jgi:hypothetical protein